MDDDKNIKDEVVDEVSQKSTGKSGKKKKSEEALEEKITDLENQLKRAVADYRNQRMRFEEEKREFVRYANRELLIRLLPAFDTLFLAEKYISDDGIKITIKHLRESLKDVGVEQVRTEGEMFNAEQMEVVTTDTGEENKVLEELRPGYLLNGKLVRPAQVKVGKGTN